MTKKFEIVYRNPAELIPYEMNAKKHDEQQIRDLAAAIRKRGFDQPITVDKHDVIITGHGRREAALLAGLDRVPVIIRDDLSEEEVKAKRLEDNRLASIDYDAIKLQQELESLVLGDVEVFGFEERELNVLVGSMTEEMEISAAMDKAQGNITSGDTVRVIFGIATILVAGFIAWSQVCKYKKGIA